MGSIIKVNEYKDFGNNAIMTSDGAGVVTINAAALKSTPAFHVDKTANQSIGNAADTKVTFDSEIFDTDSAFASDKFTCPSGAEGKYYVYCNVAFAVNSTGNRINYLYKNGSGIARLSSFAASAGSNTFASSGLVVSLAAADYLELYSYQSSGGSLNVQGTSSSPYTWFGGYKIIGA
jgi:hypothetical protein